MKTKINKSAKRVISAVVAVALLVGTLFTANVGVSINAEAANDSLSKIIWSGNKAEKFAGGSGKKEDPYIIKTPEQLLLMLNDENDGAKSVETTTVNNYTSADTYETKTFKKYLGTKYYKVADGITAFYLNDATTYEELEALATAGKAKRWNSGNTVFAGNFDGNGVTIYGLYSRWGQAFFETLDGYATVKNVSFVGAYVKDTQRVAVLATKLGEYQKGYFASGADKTASKQTYITNDSYITVSNVSVSNAKIVSDSTRKDGNPLAAGLVSTTNTPDKISFNNCFFDGSNSKLMAISGSNILFDGNWTGAEESQAYAGIAGLPNWGNNFTFNSCVSTGYPIVPMATGIKYSRYDENNGEVHITNCYSPVNSSLNYAKIKNGITEITKTTGFTKDEMPLLDWANGWHIATVEGRTIPMPTATAGSDTATDYTDALIKQLEGAAANSGNGMSSQYGKYGWHTLLSGSGTKDDPYIITNALELARAIGSGGVYLTQKLYYKLGCDIDLGGAKWLNGTTNDASYKYVPFEGTLDGDGHAVSALYAADANATGLIPTLNGGEVKNLHIRNSYAGSTTAAGLIVGEYKSGKIDGCSVDLSSTSGNVFVGTGSATVTNSIAVVDGTATYYGADGAAYTPTTDDTTLYNGENDATAKWYKGPDGVLRDLAVAKSRTIADVDGDGSVTDYYKVSDLQALRNNLLGKSDYANIYGDVNNDGETDLRDLAVIRREMVGDDTFVKDGFWRNVEVGKTKIYYAENDTYDMARRMELYLESLYPSLDVTKYASTETKAETGVSIGNLTDADRKDYKDENDAIVIVKETPTDTNYMNYSIAYDNTKNVLTVTGGSFTAVEYAVNKFIEGYNPTTEIRTDFTVSGSILDTNVADTTANTSKAKGTANVTTDGKESFLGSKTVGGQTYYYAWGDEFEEGTTYSANNWDYLAYRSQSVNTTDPSSADAGNELYFGMEVATVDSLNDLWVVDTDGKLSIKRGYNGDTVTDTEKTDAKANGYVEVKLGSGGATHPDYSSDTINSVDKYVDAGQIVTNKSMLFKQGYAEMRASLPSDGHAFPAWWFLTGTTQTKNTEYARNLYSKVYKLNDSTNNTVSHWNGTNDMDPANLATYKYQTPKAYLEFDIVEFMQVQAGNYLGSNYYYYGTTTGNYIDHLQLTVHKIYNQGVKDGTLYIPNWTDGSIAQTIARDDFVNTSSSSTGFIHKYNYLKTTTKYPYTDADAGKSTFSIGNAVKNGNIQNTYTYGFAWNVDKTAETYSIKVYVDLDDNGKMEESKGELVLEVNQDTGHDTAFDNNGTSVNIQDKDPTVKTEDEYSIWNQYAHMLLDNCYYTSNAYGKSGRQWSKKNETGITLFTDVLSKDNNKGIPDKTTFDVEYVRVYQQDGRRDIVTPATEAFNTGNHFGYGK